MRLLSLTLQDFKGVPEFTATLDGKDATIYGKNGAGKSTLANALLWVLTGKDAQGRENYNIKPLKEDGTALRQGLQPTVKAVFLRPDGETTTLCRALVEKWSTKRGRSESEYRGDETHCYVNDVPRFVTEYNRTVAEEFAEEPLLRLLTNTAYFNTQIDNAARRKLLIDAFGDVDDRDILQSEERFAPLLSVLGRHTVPDFMAMMNEQRKRANVELESLPVRMDEAAKLLVAGIDGPAASERAAALQAQIDELRHTDADADPAVSLQKQLDSKQLEADALYHAYQNQLARDAATHEEKQAEMLKRLNGAVAQAKYDLSSMSARISTQRKLIASRSQTVETCRNEWKAENATVFEADTTCPTCSQPFPAEHIEQLRGNWNQAKANRLAEITQRGAVEAEQLKAEEATLTALLQEEQVLQQTLQQAEQALKEARETAQPYQPDEAAAAVYEQKRAALDGEITTLQDGLAAAQQGLRPDNEERQAKIEALTAEMSQQQTIVLQAAQNEQVQQRIEGYERQQQEYLQQREQAEGLLFLGEEFTRAKVAKITQHINQHFQLVRFKLFEDQKNGGLKQVCEVTVDGVPYEAMNRARKVAASLDVIATFGQRYGKCFPIFVDDAEGVYETYGVNTGAAQRITLIATETDDTLRVETQQIQTGGH